MRTALRRALSTTAAGALAAGGLLVSTATPAGAATPCATACIVNATVTPSLEGAVFSFDTTGLSRAKVVVTYLDGSKPYVVKNDDTWGSTYQVTADDTNYFQQGTPYRYQIYATDTAGDTWRRSGEFATLWRSASIHYSKVHVIKDGDDSGPGDFMGSGRCGDADSTQWTALSPLTEVDVDHVVELNDGDDLPVNATLTCPGVTGSSIEAQVSLGDDDFHLWPIDYSWYGPHSPYWNVISWNESGYDEAYAVDHIADPLDPGAGGSADVPFVVNSITKDPTGATARVQFQITGTATFTHTAPMFNLESPVSARADLDVHTSYDPGTYRAGVTWDPKRFPALSAAGYRVHWRQSTSNVWQDIDIPASNASGATLVGLKAGAQYDIEVSRLNANGLPDLLSPVTMTVPGTPLKPSTITGWSTSTVTAPLGTIVTSKIQVSSPPGGRYVELQYRKPGGKWTTEVGNSTDATGHITFTYKIGVGYTKWRVYAAWTTGFDEITSAERTLAPKTVITGFNTSTVSAPTGTKINDAIVVTPGANREVDLWLKPSGAASWTFAGKFVTAANGAVTLPEVAKKGTYLWNVTVPFNVYQGSATWSANRTIIGT